jgi:hypothetical protein
VLARRSYKEEPALTTQLFSDGDERSPSVSQLISHQ